jgi:branched-chain amino acid transport system permease protein
MGASFGGVAGGVFAAMQGFVSPESFSLMESIMILAMVVLGGMGHIPASSSAPCCSHPAGSPALRRRAGADGAVRQDAGRSGKLRMLVFGLALVLVMRFKPAGLWPSPERKRELAGGRHERESAKPLLEAKASPSTSAASRRCAMSR